MLDVLEEISNRIDPDVAVGGEIASGDYSAFVKIVSMIVNVLIAVGFAVSIVAIAFSAILYILSEGEPEKTKKAWSAFINGVIAAALSLGAIAIKVIVLKAFGVDTTGISLLGGGS